MRKTNFASHGLTWAFAALLAVATTPTIHAATESAAARSRISSELPAGVSLARASVDQTAAAVRSAVSKDPGMGESILTTAIMAKTPKQGQGQLSCENLTKLTRAAVASDMKQASMLVERASSMRPDCADSLNNLLVAGANNQTNTDVPGLFDTADDYAFGSGFGPGFPGSPGFVGSPPSGSVALPAPSPTPVTSSMNG